jgi:hypothetical protein
LTNPGGLYVYRNQARSKGTTGVESLSGILSGYKHPMPPASPICHRYRQAKAEAGGLVRVSLRVKPSLACYETDDKFDLAVAGFLYSWKAGLTNLAGLYVYRNQARSNGTTPGGRMASRRLAGYKHPMPPASPICHRYRQAKAEVVGVVRVSLGVKPSLVCGVG